MNNKRLIQYKNDGYWTYWIRGEDNPCNCGANCFHKEYDINLNKIFCVCNSCKCDIYTVKDEFIEEELKEEKWL